MADNRTIFQRLGTVLNVNSRVEQPTYNRYDINKNVLLKTQSKQEYEKTKLEKQQGKYLRNVWKKVDGELFQQSLHYETTRIGSYTDFESMEFYPEIAAALDIFMEECTTVNEKGKMLNIYSDSSRIKGILEDLFYNRLDIHLSLPMWARNLAKYGDNFVLLNIDNKKGVIEGRQLPNFEMERREGDMIDTLISGRSGFNSENGNDNIGKVKFFWRGRDAEFHSWQIAHFRLLGDDRRLPYGTCLKGDTRINTEFGVEEIKDIKIGTKVWSFNTETQEKELSPILDKVMSGTKEVFKISTRHNYIDASKEHKILVASEDGKFIYKNVDDLKIGDLLVLNKNEHTNKKIKIDKSKPSENKNGWFNKINNIPDYVTEEFAQLFGFLIGDGWLETNNSTVGFALGVDVETNEFYINLMEKFSGKKLIIKDKQVDLNSKLLKTILGRMGFGGKSYEKRIPDWVFEMETDLQKAFVAGLMDADGWATRDQWTINLHIELNNKPLIEDLKILLQRIGYKSGSIRSRLRKKLIIEGRKIKNVRESHMITFYDSYLTQMKKYEFKNRKTDNFILEPIQSIQSIGNCETYDIYVENSNHNFYANNIIVHNSLLEKARRIWKQLQLAEDAMLVYRITRAPERRIYKIFVGNIDEEDVPAYVEEIANRFKRTPITDPKTGQIDLRYNTLPVWKNTPIPLLDGRTITIEELANEYENGKNNQVYSIKDDTNEVVAGNVVWCGKNYTANKMIKVWLDDKSYVVTAPEHPFILRNGDEKRADELRLGDSLMPFYKKIDKTAKSIIGRYEKVYNPNSGKYEKTHRLIAKEIDKLKDEYNTVHHVDFNKYNNRTDNLVWVDFYEHKKMHSELSKKLWKDENYRNNIIEKLSKKAIKNWENGLYENIGPKISKNMKEKYRSGEFDFVKKINSKNLTKYNKSESKKQLNIKLAKEQKWHLRFVEYNNSELHKEHNKVRSEVRSKMWKENKEILCENMKVRISDDIWKLVNNKIIIKEIYNRKTLLEFLNSDSIINNIIENNTNNRLNRLRSISRTIVEREINEKGFKTITEYIKSYKINHKVSGIEIVDGDDVYCMTVVGPNNSDDRHNFAMYSFKEDGGVNESGVFVKNSNDQDYFIPVRDENAQSPIDTLPGACISLETKIPLLDGRTMELNQIINEWNGGNRNLWVYSCDPITGQLAPGMITWCGVTRKNTEVIKITLDNGKSIVTTPDHKWLHRTKGFIEAKDLNIGDSLMPFYTKEETIRNGKKPYKMTWDNKKDKWIYDHRMVANFFKKINKHNEFVYKNEFINEKKLTIHHIDVNRYNNNPDNLTFMNNKDHYLYHSENFGKLFSHMGGKAFKDKLLSDVEFRKKHTKLLSEKSTKIWKNRTKEERKVISQKQSKGLKRYLNSLSEEELIERNSRLWTSEARRKSVETFNNNPNKEKILINKGKSISKTKSTPEFKENISKISKELWKSDEYRNKVFSKKQKLIFTEKIYQIFFDTFQLFGKADLTIKELNNNKDFMDEFIKSNKNIRSSLTNLNKFTSNHMNKMFKSKGFKNYKDWCKIMANELGYKNVRAWRYYINKNKKIEKELNYNHKIINIEWLEEKIDTGTITVDGNEIYHNYHTFATDSGVFIKNSNLNDIADISYLQRKLFTALRVPKQFLNFEDAQGDGKNLALQDVRFSRTVNRLQQSLISELNKIAIIHLYILGFQDELNNFTLTMNNPSTQAEMLKVEELQQKMTLFKDAVSDSGNGLAPMSSTRAKREILNWSDDEIKQDLLEQRMEKAVSIEMENTGNVIKHTGTFDKVDSIYGDIEVAKQGGTSDEGDDSEGGPTDFGGGGFGGGGLDFDEDDMGGEEGDFEGDAMGGEEVDFEGDDMGGEEGGTTEESLSKKIDKLLTSSPKKNKILNERVKFQDKNLKINSNINSMIKDINKLIE